MKSILLIAPDTSVKGGISTVITGLLGTNLYKKYIFYIVASHVDGSKFRKLLQAIIGLFKTAYYLIFKKIDIVHIHGGDVTSVKRKYIYFRLVKLFSRKVVYHFHGASFLEQYSITSYGWKRRIKILIEKSDIVICLSESWKTALMQIAPESKIIVIKNAISLPVLSGRKKKVNRGINIVFLGLLGERKGIFDLIKVLSRLIREGCNVHLTVGGNGDVKRLLSEIEKNGMKNNVTYAGWIAGDAKDKLLRNTDIFVLPSYAEGMPMTILEAMSYAIPVISTNVGGIPELLKDGESGFVFEAGNLEQLAQKIKQLIKDRDLCLAMGKNGRAVIERDFSINAMIDKIDNIYKTI